MTEPERRANNAIAVIALGVAVIALSIAVYENDPSPPPPNDGGEPYKGVFTRTDPAATLNALTGGLASFAADQATRNRLRRRDVLSMFCKGGTVGAILLKHGYEPDNIERIIKNHGKIACGHSDPANPPSTTPP